MVTFIRLIFYVVIIVTLAVGFAAWLLWQLLLLIVLGLVALWRLLRDSGERAS